MEEDRDRNLDNSYIVLEGAGGAKTVVNPNQVWDFTEIPDELIEDKLAELKLVFRRINRSWRKECESYRELKALKRKIRKWWFVLSLVFSSQMEVLYCNGFEPVLLADPGVVFAWYGTRTTIIVLLKKGQTRLKAEIEKAAVGLLPCKLKFHIRKPAEAETTQKTTPAEQRKG